MPDNIPRLSAEEKPRRKTKTMTYEVPDSPPTHPGVILKRTILPQKGIDAATLSIRTGISPSDISKLLEGRMEITDPIKKKLAVVFGQAADLLRDQQKAYNYFSKHGSWPPPTGPIPT